MKKDDFKRVLVAKLEAERRAGFRHCVVMLEELLDLYNKSVMPKYKAKRCDICDELFTPTASNQRTCSRCKGDAALDELVDDLFGGK